MRQLMIVATIAAVILACVPAGLAQSGPCSQQMARGIWCLSCTGFTDLSNLNPNVPKNTLVPISLLGRAVLDADGKGTSKGFGSVGGTVASFEGEESYKVNADCTGDKTYTLKIKDLGLTLPGKATVVFMPHGQEFRIMLLNAGDVVSCEYKKMFNTLVF